MGRSFEDLDGEGTTHGDEDERGVLPAELPKLHRRDGVVHARKGERTRTSFTLENGLFYLLSLNLDEEMEELNRGTYM